MTNWRYVGGAKIVQTHPVAGSSPITCDEDVTISTDPKTIDFLLDLQDGGSADATDLAMSGKVHFLHSCAKQIFSVDFCDLIELNGVACSDEGCGICTCDDSASLTGSDVASWSTMGTVLTLSLNSRGDVPYDYCLSGDSLTLRRGGIELDFERVKLGGAPQPCSSRTAASCTAGTGCYAGTCTGSTGCTNYVTEATCGVHAECTWQASGCGGFPRADCRLEDYGKVPGCDFLSLNAACGGTAKPCSQYSVTECTTVDGCSTTSSCQGPNWSCTDLCTIGFGCTDTGSGCVGTGSCNYSTGEGSCYSSYGCTWTTACGGLVPSCSSYSLTDCTTHPGCSITQ